MSTDSFSAMRSSYYIFMLILFGASRNYLVLSLDLFFCFVNFHFFLEGCVCKIYLQLLESFFFQTPHFFLAYCSLLYKLFFFFSLCPTFGGSCPGVRMEATHSVKEALNLSCGCALATHPSAFASISVSYFVENHLGFVL